MLSISNLKGTWEYKGAIFVVGDYQASSWSHGHAGIETAITGTIIEVNLGDGVKLYPNNIGPSYGPVAPADFYRSYKTYVKKKYGTGF